MVLFAGCTITVAPIKQKVLVKHHTKIRTRYVLATPTPKPSTSPPDPRMEDIVKAVRH
jgi:hypothetical protein